MTTYLIHRLVTYAYHHPVKTFLMLIAPEAILFIAFYILLIIILGGGSESPINNCSSSSDDSASDNSVPKSKMATAKAMWDECKRRGLSDAAAAGVCGQSHQEDPTLNTDEYNSGCKSCGDGGHGLFQATPSVDGSYGSVEHYGAVHHKNWRAPATQVDMFLDDWFKPYIHRHGTVSQEAYWASEAEGGGSTKSDTNEANRQGGARWFYNKFHGSAGGASDAADSAGEGSGSSCDSNSSSSADGTGSIKEHVPAWGLHYKPDEVPSDIKQYIHSPSALGMSYGSGHGWSAPGGECVNLSNSYFHLMYKTSKPYVMGNGIDIASGWSHEMSGTLSHTPHSGSVASTSNSNLTGGNSAGHTFIIQHVLANGDLIGCEENWPGKSGDDHGSPGPNRWDFFVYPKSIDKDTKYFTPKRSPRWSK